MIAARSDVHAALTRASAAVIHRRGKKGDCIISLQNLLQQAGSAPQIAVTHVLREDRSQRPGSVPLARLPTLTSDPEMLGLPCGNRHVSKWIRPVWSGAVLRRNHVRVSTTLPTASNGSAEHRLRHLEVERWRRSAYRLNAD